MYWNQQFLGEWFYMLLKLSYSKQYVFWFMFYSRYCLRVMILEKEWWHFFIPLFWWYKTNWKSRLGNLLRILCQSIFLVFNCEVKCDSRNSVGSGRFHSGKLSSSVVSPMYELWASSCFGLRKAPMRCSSCELLNLAQLWSVKFKTDSTCYRRYKWKV